MAISMRRTELINIINTILSPDIVTRKKVVKVNKKNNNIFFLFSDLNKRMLDINNHRQITNLPGKTLSEKGTDNLPECIF